MQIHNIPIQKLFPHPKNPRTSLGDVTELADSIKNAGLKQPLTVVPKGKDKYTVIIGHRRLEASKIAGLTELPCIVAEMNDKEQMATMLLENMQRSDLSLYEEAQGIQMMFDLGESVSDISSKTGFSETTVRRRMKVAKLGKKAQKLKNISMFDVDRLDNIKDENKRQELLEQLGGNSFEWYYNSALREQENAENREKILKFLKDNCKLGCIESDDEKTKELKLIWQIQESDYKHFDERIENMNFNENDYYYSMPKQCWEGIKIYRHYTDSEAREKQEISAAELREDERKDKIIDR